MFLLTWLVIASVASCAGDFTSPPKTFNAEYYKYESTTRVGKVHVDGKDYYIWADNVATGPVLVEVK